VIRAKNNLSFIRHYSFPVDKATGLKCDQLISLKGYNSAKKYPAKLKRIKFYDAEHQETYVYLTNHLGAEAIQIVKLYLNRWKVETFFKWIKQNLKIKVFWGESANAVKTQIWAAICTFVLVAILKEKWKTPHSLNNILQILSVCAIAKISVNQLFSLNNELPKNYEVHN
jgi:IS4 transposase